MKNSINAKKVNIKKENESFVSVHHVNGRKDKHIKPRRLFPISKPEKYIYLEDQNENEVGIIRDLNQLDCRSRKNVREILERFYMIPEIKEIHSLEEEYGITQWDVTTDKGRRVFEVRSRNTDIKMFPPRYVLIRDSNNNRYEISDYNNLPPQSRKLLEGET